MSTITTSSASPMLDWTFRAMGTSWRIHHSGGVSGEVAQRIADAVGADERRWSRFLPQSDMARITRGAGATVAVAPETIDLMMAARTWCHATDGVFQPLVGRQLEHWGYRQALGDAGTAPMAVGACPPGRIEISAADRTVRIPAGTCLDLGGIGKSWSAVRAGRLLADLSGDARLILDAGGDLAVLRGAHVISTAAGSVPAKAGEGVATSSSEQRRWTVPGFGTAHHLIDPATGAPGMRGTAIVIGADPVAADVLASCLVLRPALLHDLDVPAARIDLNGAVHLNDAWITRGRTA